MVPAATQGGSPAYPAFSEPPLDPALLEEFVLESTYALRDVEQDMLVIERDGAADPAAMSRIFRDPHRQGVECRPRVGRPGETRPSALKPSIYSGGSSGT